MQSATVGPLLRHWRSVRRMSQLELAGAAEVSTRHLSCVETGKARPSRGMVLVLASALEIPLRERNVLLKAAGFAPAYRESSLSDPELAPARRTLEFLLQRHAPYPAVVMDPQWNVLMSNAANDRLATALLPDGAEPPTNLLRGLFDPACLRPVVGNFEIVARALLTRLSREAVADPRSQELLDELLSYPDLPEGLTRPLLEPPDLLVPLQLELPHASLSLLTTVTTLGTAMDVTLQELRIESYFAADEATRAFFEGARAEGEDRRV